jgi:hypothetical protein
MISKIQIAVLAVCVAVAGVLYMQNRVLQKDLLVAQENAGKLELAVQEQKLTIKAAQENAGEWRGALARLSNTIEEMSSVQRKSTEEARRLANIFSRHDLGALSLARPGLIERRINAGSAAALRVLERISSGDIHVDDAPGAATGEATPTTP